jgi:magnesium-transporting ATPase (P-type)
MPFIDIFQAVVSATVSIIPEGLPTLITVTLAIGVQRMAQRQAVIRRLPAVETLGSVSRICSDKTGTLTLMEMMVVSAVTADAAYTVSGEGYAPEGDVRADGRHAPRRRDTHAHGACRGALQRCRVAPGGRQLGGGRRPDGGRALSAVTGDEIEAMDTATLQEQAADIDVFARTSPEHKLRLVKAIQASRQVVAMTGDGVNDAPALKKANVGIAMGIKGTEVTKEAAEMVLADDNFASITAAVKEGRTVYNNIVKALLFMLPTNVAEALVITAAILFNFIAPITATQILWVNMVTSVALALVISFEPHEPDVMQHPPRAIDRPIVSRFGIWRIAFVGAALVALTLVLFFHAKSTDASIELARTIAVNAIVIGQIFYLLNSRYKFDSSISFTAHLGNPYLGYSIGAVVLAQALFTYAPPFQALFHTKPIPLDEWAWLLLGGVVFTSSWRRKSWSFGLHGSHPGRAERPGPPVGQCPQLLPQPGQPSTADSATTCRAGTPRVLREAIDCVRAASAARLQEACGLRRLSSKEALVQRGQVVTINAA